MQNDTFDNDINRERVLLKRLFEFIIIPDEFAIRYPSTWIKIIR